jgi:hypothetical protein
MATSDYRILSRPMGIHWAGWRSDTLHLQRSGWQIAVDFEVYRYQYRLAMRHQLMSLYAVTDQHTIETIEHSHRDVSEMPIFNVIQCAPNLQSQIVHGIDFSRFQQIDATPQMVTQKIQRMEDLNIFSVVGRTEQVLIDKADMSVIDHLEAIKALQSEKQRDIRDRLIKDGRRDDRYQDYSPKMHLVAQLVHYDEAA